MILDCRESEWEEFRKEAIQLGRDPKDLDLLEWVVEDRIEGDLADELRYWGGDPDRLRRFWESWSRKLDELQGEFLLREDYEKCARIQQIRSRLSGSRSL